MSHQLMFVWYLKGSVVCLWIFCVFGGKVGSLTLTVVLCGFFFIHLFRVLHRFQHCTCHITMGSWKGRGNQYIKWVKVLYF